MIAIVDYGVGNLFSLESSFCKIGAKVTVTKDKTELQRADKIILPGVGAFGDAAEKLRKSGLGDVVKERANAGVPLMGICLGMQLLFEKSYEYGEYDGLGILPGKVVPMKGVIPENLKIPHIGWNALKFTDKKSRLFSHIKNGDFVYFVHSYFATECEDNIIAYAEYGKDLCAAVEKDNVFGCQFHPEKSGDVGLEILREFCEL